MPIRAYCTICSDFFDHYKDVSAIHCGHTFHNECLLQWFQTAPTKTCPQCRKHVSTRHIISKLFFDVGGEEDSSAVDPERLQNELDRVKALLTTKEKDMRDKQKMAEALRETVEKQKLSLESVRKMVDEKDKLCSALRKQMKYLEIQQSETQHAKEEAQRLRVKMKTYESLDLVLHGQQAEVEAMISDMGVGQSAVHQLSIYCISLKKEYENLKSSHRSSNEMCEKLRRELLATNNKLQKSTLELNRSKEETKAIQQDLRNSDKEITSLKKKIEILQKTLSTPTRTNEALSRLILESPAPRELKQHNNEDIDLNLTFDVSTPEPVLVPTKMTCLEPTDVSPSNHPESAPSGRKRTYVQDKDVLQEPCLRDSILFKKKTFASMLDPHRSRVGAVRMGYDGLGGRMRFIQPSPLSEIRPLAMKAKRKKVSRPPPRQQLTLDALCG